MRIGIDFLFAQHGTTQGYDSCTRNLLSGLDKLCEDHEIIVFCNTPYFLENREKFTKLQLVDCHGKWQNRFFRAVWETVFLPILIHKFGIDGVYFPTHFRPLFRLGRVWSVFNLYDLHYRYIPNSFGKFQLFVRNYYYKLSLEKCDRSICLSEFVKETAKEQFPSINEDRLIVIPVPITFDNQQPPSIERSITVNKFSPFILSIGMHLPHKNFETLIRAFALLIQKTDYTGSLIIGGSFTSHTETLKKLTFELSLTERVDFLGYVSNLERERLFRSTDVFVFPSLYEGFGMPPVEAMGRNVPVVCSETTALPEVTLGLANYYSPATDANALAQAIIKVIQKPPEIDQLQVISNRVRQMYNNETISRRYLDLWESLG